MSRLAGGIRKSGFLLVTAPYVLVGGVFFWVRRRRRRDLIDGATADDGTSLPAERDGR